MTLTEVMIFMRSDALGRPNKEKGYNEGKMLHLYKHARRFIGNKKDGASLAQL